MYLPAIVMVGHYFDKKRALVTGISVCGSSIGIFIFAPFGTYLVEEYGWRGANMIFAGIILNGVVFGAIMRPLEVQKRVGVPKSQIMKTIAAEKKRQRTISVGSSNGAVITNDNMLVPWSSQNNNANGGQNIDGARDATKLELLSEGGKNGGYGISASETALNSHEQRRSSFSHRDGFGSRNRMRTASGGNGLLRIGGSSDKTKEAANPFNRADVLYQGSVQHLPEYQASQNMAEYIASVARIPQPDADSESSDHGLLARVSNASRIIFEMFNFSLLKSPTFVVVCLSGVLIFVGGLSYYFQFVMPHFWVIGQQFNRCICIILSYLTALYERSCFSLYVSQVYTHRSCM